MDIHLALRRSADGILSGEAVYENIAGEFDFALDQNFAPRSGCPLEKAHTMPDVYLDKTNTLVYRKADIYRIAGEMPGSIRIAYELCEDFTSDIGFNRISEEIIALDALHINFYPVPMARATTEKIRGYQTFKTGEESVIEFGELTFSIEGFEPYRVINCDGGHIKRFCKMVPFKLLAVDESKILKQEHGRVTAYYFNEKESGKAAKIVEEASRMIDWFSAELFPGREAPERMYFFSYDAKKLGGFNRSITIELERFYSPATRQGRYLLAHEIAHYWCMSEPPAVWNEQMLAEGCADWSHLLYAQSGGRLRFAMDRLSLAGMYLVNSFVNKVYGIIHRTNAYNIHLRGYRLFRGIYRRHGRDVLDSCIRHFNRIEIKTMESFLNAVKADEARDIYASIEKLATKNFR